MTVVFWGLVRTPEAERDHPAIQAAADRLGTTWRILDHHLASRLHVTGDELTMGDIPVGCACYRYFELPIERPRLPNLETWYGRLRKRAAFRTHVMIPVT
jgi:glutathione S-transferase